MALSVREFDTGPDPFGNPWHVKLIWLQTAISIRHADAIDVKFFLTQGDRKLERVVALRDPDLLALSKEASQPITDPWCMRLAAMHIKHMVESGEDFEKTLVTVSPEQLRRYAAMLAASPA